jgi:uncharacterized protein YqgC (DUF456 family)
MPNEIIWKSEHGDTGKWGKVGALIGFVAGSISEEPVSILVFTFFGWFFGTSLYGILFAPRGRYFEIRKK